jgi:hypothetical protein
MAKNAPGKKTKDDKKKDWKNLKKKIKRKIDINNK